MIKSFRYFTWSSLLLLSVGTAQLKLELGLDPTKNYHNLYGATMLAADAMVLLKTPVEDFDLMTNVGFANYRWEAEATRSTYKSSGAYVKLLGFYRIYKTLALGGGFAYTGYTTSRSYTTETVGFANLERNLGPYNRNIFSLEMNVLYTRYFGQWGFGIMPRMTFILSQSEIPNVPAQGAIVPDPEAEQFQPLYLPGLGVENATASLYPSIHFYVTWRNYKK